MLQLGARKDVTVEQRAQALENIRNIFGDQKMDPNMKSVASRLFNKMLRCETMWDVPSKDIEGNMRTDFNNLEKSFLPCEGGLLCDHKDLLL